MTLFCQGLLLTVEDMKLTGIQSLHQYAGSHFAFSKTGFNMSVVAFNWPFLYVFSNLCNPQISKVNAKKLGGPFGSPNIFPSRSMT